MSSDFCGATTWYKDPPHKPPPVPVPRQIVTCVRDPNHPGIHSGVAHDVDGDAVFHFWKEENKP
jgi:hypothetical protein